MKRDTAIILTLSAVFTASFLATLVLSVAK